MIIAVIVLSVIALALGGFIAFGIMRDNRNINGANKTVADPSTADNVDATAAEQKRVVEEPAPPATELSATEDKIGDAPEAEQPQSAENAPEQATETAVEDEPQSVAANYMLQIDPVPKDEKSTVEDEPKASEATDKPQAEKKARRSRYKDPDIVFTEEVEKGRHRIAQKQKPTKPTAEQKTEQKVEPKAAEPQAEPTEVKKKATKPTTEKKQTKPIADKKPNTPATDKKPTKPIAEENTEQKAEPQTAEPQAVEPQPNVAEPQKVEPQPEEPDAVEPQAEEPRADAVEPQAVEPQPNVAEPQKVEPQPEEPDAVEPQSLVEEEENKIAQNVSDGLETVAETQMQDEAAETEPVVADELKASEPASAEPEANSQAVSFVQPVVAQSEVRAEVAATEVDKIMSDEVAVSLIEKSEGKTDKTKQGIINIDTLSQCFVGGEIVTLDEIKKRIKGFNKKTTYIKVLARGTLDKPLTVEADSFSLQAVKMIVLTGGKVIKKQ